MSGPDAYFETANEKQLASAIAAGDRNAVRTLLAGGDVDPATIGRDATTFLSIAILAKQKDVFEQLLQAGALGDPRGKTAGESMYIATLTDDIYWLKRLLEAGADPNNFGGGNLLIVQAMNSRLDGRLDFYLEQDIDLEAKTNLGGTIALEAARLSRFDLTNQFLALGASPWVVDDLGTTIGYRAEATAKVPAWDKNSKMEVARRKLLATLHEQGFPDPAPMPDEALAMVEQGHWPPVGKAR